MARFVNVRAAPARPDRALGKPRAGRRANDRADAAGRVARLRPRGISGMRAHRLLPALVLRPAGRTSTRIFEREMPNAATQPLFDCARELGIGFYLGFAELAVEGGVTHHFNTSILVDKSGRIIGKYRKVHLPGHAEHEPSRPFQNLEKRYFEVGNLGFPVFRAFGGIVGMAICNDRRWPETYRVMGLQGVEMVVLGYNTPVHNPPSPEHDNLAHFHNALVMQAGAYQNGCWVVGVAKAGDEDGVRQIGNSIIVAPSGEIVAACSTEGDELAIARCDLDLTLSYKNTTFNFAKHRQPQAYRLIVERKGQHVMADGTPVASSK